jgi:very-short-patch-repair endonuclease
VHELAALFPDGAARRDRVTLATSSSSVTRWMTRGDLVLVHPGVLALADCADEWPVRARAAVLWARGPLSHLSALAVHRLVPVPPPPLHVTVPADRWPRGCSDVVAHRTTLPLDTVRVTGLPVLDAARSLVDSWSWAAVPRRDPHAAREVPLVRQAVIEAVRTRAVDVEEVRAASVRQRLHAGRPALTDLLDLVAGGCQSELEVFGVLHVLRGAGMPPFVQQHRVGPADGRSVFLDAAWPELRVAVELDGAAFHGSRDQRERDLRRDTALAALGWVVLRFSYRRLTTDPAGCRREIEAVLRRRLAER